MARYSRNQTPGRLTQSIIVVEITWLVTLEIKCQEGTVSITLKIHGSVKQKPNARKAQSIIDVEYTWLGATEIKC